MSDLSGRVLSPGTPLLTDWGPAVVGKTYSPEDGNVQVIYQDGATHCGADLAGTCGAFSAARVRGWVTSEERVSSWDEPGCVKSLSCVDGLHSLGCPAHNAGRPPSSERAEKVAALRAYLDSLDEQTRLPGEPPLREAVAQQARERLAEMDEAMDLCPEHKMRDCSPLLNGCSRLTATGPSRALEEDR